VTGFRSAGNIRVFENGWNDEAASFAPQSIAATPAELASLPLVASVKNVLIALVRPGDPSLSEGDREHLWRAFRVPVFEQRIDDRCKLLAAECEAHDGLHVESPGVSPRPGELMETAPCGCGRTTPRLIATERAENVRRVAAYAR
jgi:hypothetical protein